MHIDRNRCKGCKKCIEACPNSAIRIIKKKAYIFRTRCKECSLCVNVCPKNAIMSSSRGLDQNRIGRPRSIYSKRTF